MKKNILSAGIFLAVVFTVLCGVGINRAEALGPNLIANPSFENGTGGAPDYWYQGNWGTNTAVFTYPVDGFVGDQSRASKVEITNYPDIDTGIGGDAKWYFADVSVTSGKSYRFHNKYLSTVPSLVVAQFNLGGSPSTYSYLQIGSLAPSGSWQDFESDFIAPAGTVGMTVFHLIQNVGSLIVDDYSLSEIVNENVFSKGMVSLAFDDGWRSVYQNAIPKLDLAGIKSTQYIISDYIGDSADGYMTLSEISSMKANGHDIGAHSMGHPDLTALDLANLEKEVFGSRLKLLDESLGPSDSFAYPYGTYNDFVKQKMREAGFLGARTVEGGYNDKATDRYALKVGVVERNTTLAEVKGMIDTAEASNTWLILVFHQIDNNPENIYGNSPEILQGIIDYLLTVNVDVVIVSEALSRMPNVLTSDTIAPVIAVSGDVEINTESTNGENVDYVLPLVTDNVDSGLGAFCTPTSGSLFEVGVTTVVCKSMDSSGNEAVSTSFKIKMTHAPESVNPPIANDQTVATDEDNSLAITLSASDSDGDVLVYSVVSNPIHGTLSGTAPNLTYVPSKDYFGSDSFTFKANDGTYDSNTAVVNITVNSVNDAPVVESFPKVSFPAGGSVTVDLTNYATDVDNSVTELVWSALGNNNVNISINPVTRVAKISALNTWVGTETAIFKAVDPSGLAGIGSMKVVVTKPLIKPEAKVSMKISVSGSFIKTAMAEATIVDASGKPITGAIVSGVWGGLYVRSATGMTSSGGVVKYPSGAVRGTGTLKFTVTKIVKAGVEYLPTGEVTKSVSL